MGIVRVNCGNVLEGVSVETLDCVVQKTLEQTQENLYETTEGLKQANFAIRERDFVIANQREAGQQPTVVCRLTL